MASEGFPLMDCPRELRDMIYREALCTMEFDESAPPGVVVMDKMNVSLLRVNHKVSEEATEAMLRANLFIGVVVHGLNLARTFNKLHLRIPVMFLGTDLPTVPGIVMKHVMSYRPPSPKKQSFIIPHRHFDTFCHALFLADFVIPEFSWRVSHSATIYDKFLGTEILYTPDFKKHESLLEPYRKRLYLCAHFNRIYGPVSPQLAGHVLADVQRGLVTDPTVLLKDIQHYKALAKQCASRMDRHGAWEAQLTIVHQVDFFRSRRDGKSWYDLQEKKMMSKELQRQIARIWCTTQAKMGDHALFVLLKALRILLGDALNWPFPLTTERPPFTIEIFDTACQGYLNAIDADGILGVGSILADDERFHILYQLATTFYYMRAELTWATSLINTVRLHRPHWPFVQLLYEKIQKWKEDEPNLNYPSPRIRARWL